MVTVVPGIDIEGLGQLRVGEGGSSEGALRGLKNIPQTFLRN